MLPVEIKHPTCFLRAEGARKLSPGFQPWRTIPTQRRVMSRRDDPIVAWHEVPGTRQPKEPSRGVRYGSCRWRTDSTWRTFPREIPLELAAPIIPYPTGRSIRGTLSQALRAWLVVPTGRGPAGGLSPFKCPNSRFSVYPGLARTTCLALRGRECHRCDRKTIHAVADAPSAPPTRARRVFFPEGATE
jgi:hypothetical protein